MRRILVTGGAGFVGSHVAESFARRGVEVVAVDNLSRGELLHKQGKFDYNWRYLSDVPGVRLVKGDVRDPQLVAELARDVDAIVHAAAQTAVTTSVEDPLTDFSVNALGTVNVLEAARRAETNPAVIVASTNKVYGDNVNKIPLREDPSRWAFADEHQTGVPEALSIDHCEHTPYGTSKTTADLYAQDYHHLYGLKTGVFRMSCIYGDRQLGVEDQGWVAWFALATLEGRPVTIYGDGKQVRDILHVSDLVAAYEAFLDSNVRAGVWNTGGGPQNTTSLLEYLDLLERITGTRTRIAHADWRPSDQKVYVSDIRKITHDLGWAPKVGVEEGVRKMVAWIDGHLKAVEETTGVGSVER